MTRSQSWFACFVALLLLSSCAPCERNGCDAYQRRSSAKIRQGVGGVVAILSDVVGNGCQECPLGKATLRVWRAETPIATAEAAQSQAAAAPTSIVDADRRYELALEPADYLLCAGQPAAAVVAPCAAFTVVAGKVTTINVELRDGPASLLVFDANESAPRPETFEFSGK